MYFSYSHQLPNFKIIIIENELPHSLIDIKPWCGISTLNHYKFNILNRRNFLKFLINYTIPIGKISIQSIPQNLYNPTNEIMTTIIDPNNPVGLLYHPSQFMSNMRLEMYNSGKVSFMSCNSNYHKQEIYNNHKGLIVSSSSSSSSFNQGNSIIYNSNLIQVNCLNGQTPNSILWLPKLQYNQDIRHMINQTNIILDTSNTDPIVNIDLNYALKQGDIVLSAINNLIGTSIHLGNKL